jgi:hypothetical protein
LRRRLARFLTTTRKNGRYAIDRQGVDMQPPARKTNIDKGFRATEDPDTYIDDSLQRRQSWTSDIIEVLQPHDF